MKLLVREQIKTLLVQEGVLLKELAAMISEKTGKIALLMYCHASLREEQ